MILDDVAEIMSSESTREMSRRTGLSKDKIYRMANGISFVLDHEVITALQRMGYEIRLEKLSRKSDN